MEKPKTLRERFEEQYIPEPMSGCWLWTAWTDVQGYGRIRFGGGKRMGAHRASYLIHKGALDSNLCVLHRCDTPSCVNPDHLFLGTNNDNVRDRVKKDRSCRRLGIENVSAKLKEAQVLEIKSAPRYITHTHLAKRFGVSGEHISRIRNGEAWKHLNAA